MCHSRKIRMAFSLSYSLVSISALCLENCVSSIQLPLLLLCYTWLPRCHFSCLSTPFARSSSFSVQMLHVPCCSVSILSQCDYHGCVFILNDMLGWGYSSEVVCLSSMHKVLSSVSSIIKQVYWNLNYLEMGLL